VFGGWVNDRYGWRVAFLCQVPCSVLALVLVGVLVRIPVRESETARWKRIDILGAGTLVVTLILLLIGLNSGGNVVPWTHPLVLTTLPLSAVSLLAFLWIETKVAEPIIPVRLFLDRTILSACLGLWLQSMATFGFIFYGPIYFQVVKGMSATQAGVRLIPQSVGIAIGSLGTGLLLKYFGKYWWINVIIELMSVTALSFISTFTVDTPQWLPFIYFFFQGMAYAAILTVTLIALIAACEHKFQAVITSASYAFRSTGSVIGVTIASSVFRNILQSELWERFGHQPELAKKLKEIQDNFDIIKELPEEFKRGVLDVYMDALRGVFLTLLGIAAIGAVISLFMRENKLHNNLARRPSDAA
jgi:MFS family permease